jgi:hypothetical protein
MSIPVDQYFTVDPSSEFKSKAHGILFSQELFFYVADTGELRVRAFNGLIAYAIAQNVIWASALTAANRVDLWYATSGGAIFYIPYFHFGSGTLAKVPIGISAALTFDVFYCLNSTPPVYCMVTDNGIVHTLYVADDPAFSSIRATKQIYSNAQDTSRFVTRPRIAMHPQDTTRMTVHCQTILLSNGQSSTGFYVVKVPTIS